MDAQDSTVDLSSSSSLVLCPRAGPWLPNSPILSVFSLPLQIPICLIYYIIDHDHSWPSPWSLSFHSSFQHQFHQTISPYNPVQFFFLPHIVFIKLLLSFMELSTCSFVPLSIQLTFPILLHTHIAKAFKRFISSFLMVHVSHPNRNTGHTSVQPASSLDPL